MGHMLWSCWAFLQPIGRWDVSSVTNYDGMIGANTCTTYTAVGTMRMTFNLLPMGLLDVPLPHQDGLPDDY